ncbi:hypothetical protein K469DRAFT_684928 [Zopfia rhizophila CBS 207.26]|uniref:F-box domain-containing protein n=1 Tax=Zopfia rhizophila CBS 207.26 TaxID=1314779 RepID=A0A6A6EDJ6_9PEZI|nr:hypothetical protein K469DRAFT_684928 [Zopfia rhizophila CBS 207.26]
MTPPSPSYARATSSSSSKESSKSPKTKDVPPKKLKRPSSLSNHERQLALLLRHQKALTIKPMDPTKPCPLASLPSEVRVLIYRYVFDIQTIIITLPRMWKYGSFLWPNLLRVSRAVRHEASYEFYSRTSFEGTILELDFSPVKKWVKQLPVAHRLFLSRNQKLVLELMMNDRIHMPDGLLTEGFNYAGKTLRDLWEECRRFGNLYDIHGLEHRLHFVRFSRLADWFLWCGRPIHSEINWHHRLAFPNDVPWTYSSEEWARRTRQLVKDNMIRFLRDSIAVPALPCVQGAKISAKQKTVMKKEALNLLEGLNKVFRDLGEGVGEESNQDWERRVASLRRYLERW